MLQDAFSAVIAEPVHLSGKLATACQQQWMKTTRKGAGHSVFQGDVVAVLQGMGTAPQLEVITKDGLFSIDVRIMWRNK